MDVLGSSSLNSQLHRAHSLRGLQRQADMYTWKAPPVSLSTCYRCIKNKPSSSKPAYLHRTFPSARAHVKHSLLLVSRYYFSTLQLNNSLYIASILYYANAYVMAIPWCYFLIEYALEPHSQITYKRERSSTSFTINSSQSEQ